MSGDYHPGRDASPPVNIFGIPALAWLIFALWFKWPSTNMFLFCIGLILFYVRRGDLFKITVIRCDLTEFVVIQGDRRKRLSR